MLNNYESQQNHLGWDVRLRLPLNIRDRQHSL
jgi:hypothetical protein